MSLLGIGYVCTNFNNSRFTQVAVASLLTACPDAEVVVVDNDSSVDEKQRLTVLKERFPGVTLIFNRENVGYFRGLNVGIRQLRSRNEPPRYLLVGNNDLEFPPDLNQQLTTHKSTLERYPVVSPDIVTADGVHQNPHVIATISKRRELVYDLYYSSYALARLIGTVARVTRVFTDRRDEDHWQEPRFIYQGHGACYVIGPKFFEHFTELWAPTFLMGEEFFLSKLLSDRGLQVYYEPGIQVVHHCHAAVSRIPSKTIWKISRESHREYRRYVRLSG
jgi:GT2 family glycosyltransferase